MFHQPLAILVTLSVLALSAFALPPGAVTCGYNVYSPADVQNAIYDGRSYSINGYPHRYGNREGLGMWCAGSVYYEAATDVDKYPIKPSGLYSHTSHSGPGADRVVFDNTGAYCAVMTHTGASYRNGFVGCHGY